MSKCLADRSIDHVVIERGLVANSWRTERWDSLKLLTPNWQSRLPGYGYEGNDPDGYRTMPETVAFIDRYANVISAPVRILTLVTSVRRIDTGYLVSTDQGDWKCRSVVMATGECNIPRTPGVAEALPAAAASPMYSQPCACVGADGAHPCSSSKGTASNPRPAPQGRGRNKGAGCRPAA